MIKVDNSTRYWFSSDFHFGHDVPFLYEKRGFRTIKEHDDTIVHNWNQYVAKQDIGIILGDLVLNDNMGGVARLNQLNCREFIIILGNHDTKNRIKLYKTKINRPVYIAMAEILKKGKHHFYLSHYPTITSNPNDFSKGHQLINLYGHTHQSTNFYKDVPFMYHVGVDSHNNYPVLLETIIEDIAVKKGEVQHAIKEG